MITYRTLRPAELEAWYAHCQSVFQEEDADYFRKHYERDPQADPDLIFVALDGDVIVSTMRVFVRRVWIQGRVVSMGGIGEVSTKPAYRRKGIAAALLQLAISAMTARGMHISILFGDQPIYGRAGWQFCGVGYTEVRVDALPPMPDGMSVRPFEEGDLPYLMGMYDLTAARMDGAVYRTEAYWRRWALPHLRALTVLEAEGRPAAYCAGAPMEEDPLSMRLMEIAFAPQAEDAAPCLLSAFAQAQGAHAIRFPAPILPRIRGKRIEVAKDMMCRLNLPLPGAATTEALVRAMAHPGMFDTDHF